MAREKIAIMASQASRFPVKTSESLTGDRVISQAEVDRWQGFVFAPTAARNCDLPAEEGNAGAFLYIKNAAGGDYTLTVRNDAAGTVKALTQGQVGIFFCDGSSWYAIGA
jgi:hypothetical protein